MKYLIFLFLLILFTNMEAQVNAIEWANLSKYKEANLLLKNDSINALFLGNSITEGWVSTMPTFFSKNNYVGRGISGQTSAQVLLRFRQDVVDLRPKLVVINIGTNDVAENTGPYDENFTLGNITSMIDIAQAHHIKVILASVLPASSFVWRTSIKDVGSKIVSLNQRLINLANKYQIPYLDYHSPLKNKENGLDFELAHDGVHPNLKCYEIMASLAYDAVDKELKK